MKGEYPYWDDRVRVTIIDTLTGETVTSHMEWSFSWWQDGNGSCDCNRESLFPDDVTRDGEPGVCAGCERYVIVDCSIGHLDELNSEYAPELVKNAMDMYAKVKA